MRRYYYHTLALFGLLLGSCDRQKPQGGAATQASRVKVGVLTTITGSGAAYGEFTKRGIELALNDIPDPGFDLVYKDTRGDVKQGVEVFKELLRDRVPIVIGPFTSTEVRVIAREAQRNSTTLITSSATADDLSALGEFIFMMLPPNSQQAADQANFALSDLKRKKTAILYRQNPYGETLREAFRRAFTAGGGVVVKESGFPDGTEDFRDRLKDLLQSSPDVVFIPSHDEDTGRILRQAREVNVPLDVKFLGCDGSMSQTMLQLAGRAAEGAIFSNVASASSAFDTAYARKYSETTSPYSASAYDTLMIIQKLIKDGARTGKEFQGGFVSLLGYDGATGVTKFTKVDKSYWALGKVYQQYQVRSGQFVIMQKGNSERSH